MLTVSRHHKCQAYMVLFAYGKEAASHVALQRGVGPCAVQCYMVLNPKP